MLTPRMQLAVWGIAAIAVMIVAGVLAGLWAGNRWAEGQHAIERNRELHATAKRLTGQIEKLHQHSADAVLAYDQAAQRLDLIAQEQERDRETNRRFREGVRADLEQVLEARPDLRGLRLGTDVLQHWNRGNAGPTATPAAAGDSRQPAAAVPAAAPGRRRQGLDAAGQPRPGDRAVPRLPHGQGRVEPRGTQLGGNGVGLVLPRGHADGDIR